MTNKAHLRPARPKRPRCPKCRSKALATKAGYGVVCMDCGADLGEER